MCSFFMLTASFPGWCASLLHSEEEAEAASAETFSVKPSSLQWFRLSAYVGIPLPHSKTKVFLSSRALVAQLGP